MTPAAIPLLSGLLAWWSDRKAAQGVDDPLGQPVYGWPDGDLIERIRTPVELELDEFALEQGIHVNLEPSSGSRVFSYRDARGPLATLLFWQDLATGRILLLDLRGNPDIALSELVAERLVSFVRAVSQVKLLANAEPHEPPELGGGGSWLVPIPEAFAA